MKAWLYHWLPIIFGCHCMDERSFHWRGERFPICARCTGELIGIVMGLISCAFFRIPVKLAVIMMIPMIIDGVIQMSTAYNSNNFKRVVTGCLFGYALAMLFVISSIAAFQFGISLTQ